MHILSPDSGQSTLPCEIVVKDSWIDPLWKFTEGSILTKLNSAGVEGVPKLIHKQQVQAPYPSNPNLKYHIHVLSHLLTKPRGQQAMNFSSLAKLLVTFIDYVLIHKNVITKANILHRDISLLNLLLVSWNALEKDHSLKFLNNLPQATHQELLKKLVKLSCWGLLANWGYTVPLDAPCSGVDAAAQLDLTANATLYQSPEAGSSPLTSLSPDSEAPPMSPVDVPLNILMNAASDLGKDTVPVQALVIPITPMMA
ncbi:hypothetical protein PISMIDRAFT_15760 [Pisolithus microcarpus 441]|uniref:Fungal-type protein kinase domain-containing protein n=1 Tax=Pisolithus microcarpus 441 TaxID=765257 RepID=A0A0C9XVX2_9AGAM|nr:hypothetical protein BKA83DRAFT_15760 [Pisolithus microcarpus]KIK16550.1 hypothetical protein PISMIDRAFT_15760 [Pisolithus microcarpus 441]